MTNQHPITPPPELVQQWINEEDGLTAGHISTQAAQWGADQELEACCQTMKSVPSPLGVPFGEMASNALRAARRPQPLSDKEQALNALSLIMSRQKGMFDGKPFETIRNLGYSYDMCDEIVDAVEEFEKSKEPEKWDVVRESKKWCEENPEKSVAPEFLKFELGKTLEGLIEEWWCDVFTRNSDLSMEESIDCLVTMICYWLPKEQNASGSQNVDVEFLVEGFNDAIKKIKGKLYNKKDT